MKKKREQYSKLLQMLEDSDLNVSAIDEDRITIPTAKSKLIITCQNDMFSIHEQYAKKPAKYANSAKAAFRIISGFFAEEPEDVVNHPSHYNHGGVETIEIIKCQLTAEEFRGYLKGNILKYRDRHPYKGKATEDLAKAKWYYDRLKQEEVQG